MSEHICGATNERSLKMALLIGIGLLAIAIGTVYNTP